MGGRRVDGLGHAGGGAVAVAVAGGAQVRAALHDLAGDAGRVPGIDGAVAVASPRVVDGAAGVGDLARPFAVVLVPVADPLPHVAGHLEQAVAIGRERPHRGGVLVAVEHLVADRELALPHVGHVPPAGGELVAPGVLGALEATTGGALPLGLGGQLLARPGGIRLHVVPPHVDDRVVVEAFERALWAPGVAPRGAGHVDPPL